MSLDPEEAIELLEEHLGSAGESAMPNFGMLRGLASGARVALTQRDPKRPEQKALWLRLVAANARLDELSDTDRNSREQQYAELHELLEDLHSETTQFQYMGHGEARQLWNQLKEAAARLRNTRLPRREDGHTFQSRLDDMFSTVQHISEESRDAVLQALSAADPSLCLLPFETDSVEDTRTRLDRAFAARTEAREMFNEHRGRLLGRHYHELRSAFEQTNARLSEAQAQWKESKAEERRSNRKSFLEEKAREIEQWLDNNRDRLQRAEENREKLDDMLAHAHSEERQDQIEAWIADADKRIENLRARVEKDEERLSAIHSEITELDGGHWLG